MDTCVMAARSTLGWWTPGNSRPLTSAEDFSRLSSQLSKPVFIVKIGEQLAISSGGTALLGGDAKAGDLPLVAYSPALPLQRLGDPSFCQDHGLLYPYVAGAMANGIASEELVAVMAEGGMLGFFGSAGLSPKRVEQAIDRLQARLGDKPFGLNLIHSPNESGLEDEVVDLYLRKKVRLVSASAYMGLTLPLVRYRLHGIHRNHQGEVITPNKIIAKVSRVEVARHFFSPVPDKMLNELVQQGHLTSEQAELAKLVPVARDLTAEADSGGHTDNRPALALVPTMIALANRLQAQFGYQQSLRVGAAGGIATPSSAAAAFAMGASYILTGSINQSCLEAGTSDMVRKMLAEAGQADIAMAPAADMFEMGVKVQVLKRGTMFAMRAAKLFELYRQHAAWEDIPAKDQSTLERQYFRQSFAEAWASTRSFFQQRDPRQIVRADADPKHKMALVFRSYLGLSSRWANAGDASRRIDYQVWCGPAMGAFNEWVRGSFLEAPENRRAVPIAMNLLLGAALLTRARELTRQGVKLADSWISVSPRKLEDIQDKIQS